MHRNVGSEWYRWDLHVHTPASIANNQYGGDSDRAWDRFFSDVEALPESFKVLGINDYLFLDGYRRVLDARDAGRMGNIELFLPVIELRLDRFGGTDGKLSRVNFHAIFSDKLDPALIESQFINALKVDARLKPSSSHDRPSFKGVITRAALEDFGRAIIESVPEAERAQFDSPLSEGFNAATFTLDSVRDALQSTYFEKSVLTAIGKTEWWDIKWNAQSIADKKDIINGADFVFTAADGPSGCAKSLEQLTGAGVNNRLLDCSDAHDFSDSGVKDRIGNCCTWLCADTEFEGLRQVRKEPERRIFLGDEPPTLQRVREYPRRVIKSVEIDRVAESSDGLTWFERVSLELNPALVAIIGKKGSGKSALADTLGLLGHTSRMDHASFLNPKRFRSGGLASQFQAKMHWHAGEPSRALLSHDPPEGVVASVNYVPQDFFEEICNELMDGEQGQFDRELKDVIFSWVPDDDRLGHSNLDELLAYHIEETESALHSRRGSLSKVNSEILKRRALLRPESSDELQRLLEAKQDQLKAHLSDKPDPVELAEPQSGTAPDVGLAPLSESLRAAEQAEEAAKTQRTTLVAQESMAKRLRKRLNVLRNDIDKVLAASEAELTALGLKESDVIEYEIRIAPIDELRQELEDERASLDAQLDDDEEAPGSLVASRRAARAALQAAQQRLEAPARAREEYVEALREWTAERDTLVGTPEAPESLRGLASRCRRLLEFPAEIERLEVERRDIITAIHDEISSIADQYRTLYRPVQQFIDTHPIVADKFELRFNVSIDPARFRERFLAQIHHGRMGTFQGKADGEKELDGLLQAHDFNTAAGTVAFVEATLQALRYDRNRDEQPERRIEDQLVDGESVEDLVDFVTGLGYLSPRYRLRLGDRPIEQLSPGEKGALLLVFYLLVDKGREPLIIDQPEGNLDNETVFSLLVPSIMRAKVDRQVIIVTHNPNLAVVCDAEQVVIADRSVGPDGAMTYRSGAIEAEEIRSEVIKVLEGTKPAFMNREHKYLR